MKTKKKTPALSSVKELNFKFPKSWQELSQKQLKSVFVFLSAYPEIAALVKIACYFSNLVIVRKVDDGLFSCRLATEQGVHTVTISSVEMVAMTDAFEWVKEPGEVPVLLGNLYGNTAIDTALHGVPFETYLMLENLFQGYLMSNDEKAVCEMASLVYPGETIKVLKPFEVFALCLWFTQLKAMFSSSFPNFFKPVSGSSAVSMVDVMHAEIRALTGGDITKTSLVLEADTWVALAELDAKAREAEEFNKLSNK